MTTKKQKIRQIIFEAFLVLSYAFLVYAIVELFVFGKPFFGNDSCVIRQALFLLVPVAFIVTNLLAKRFYDKKEKRLIAFKKIKNECLSNFLVLSFVIWVEILILGISFVFLFVWIARIASTNLEPHFCATVVTPPDLFGIVSVFKVFFQEGYSFCKCQNIVPIDYLVLAGVILLVRIIFILVKKINENISN